MSERSYWLSCPRFTVLAETDGAGIITRTAPITKKFVGQKLENLTTWMQRLTVGDRVSFEVGEEDSEHYAGGFEMAELAAAERQELAETMGAGMTDKVTDRNRCPGSRTVERLPISGGRAVCRHCHRWVPVCRDGTMRSHPRSSDSLSEHMAP